MSLSRGGQKRALSDSAKIKAALQEICENQKVGDTAKEVRGVWNRNNDEGGWVGGGGGTGVEGRGGVEYQVKLSLGLPLWAERAHLSLRGAATRLPSR